MRLPKFEYAEPDSIEEASSILLDRPDTKVLAGGTDLLVNMKHRIENPSTLVNLKHIPGLEHITRSNGEIRIGALTPLKKLYKEPMIAEGLPALSVASSSVGAYHHQTMGTIGGNICQQTRCKYYNQSKWWRRSRPLCFKAGGEVCHVVSKNGICYSSYCGDIAPVLLVMNAGVVIKSSNATRQVPLRDIFSGDGKVPLNLKKEEILTEIVIPGEAAEGFSTYTKFANRGSIDFPIVGVAFWTSPDRKDSRIALTAVDRKPLRAKKTEDYIKENGLREDDLEEIAVLASREASPTTSSIYSPSFKRKIMGLLIKGVIREALGK